MAHDDRVGQTNYLALFRSILITPLSLITTKIFIFTLCITTMYSATMYSTTMYSATMYSATKPLYAAPPSQIIVVRGPQLSGELPYQYNAHYLGLEATQRDGLISLLLTYEPQNNPNLRGYVNFFVLDEDGLRRFQAGDDPEPLAIAGGSPVQFDRIGNKMGAAFRASGHGRYTVVVYNNALIPITYSLRADGGLLIDNANQTRDRTADTAADIVEEPNVTPLVHTTQATASHLGSASGQRLSGVLSKPIMRHYLEVVPTIRNGTILFNFHYDPLDQPVLRGNVNFWILDEAGLDALIRGEHPREVNLATGFPAPFSPFPNDLQANFNASGKEPYTVVVFNRSSIPATYDLLVDGGVLYDLYGQTNEARVSTESAVAEFVTVETSTTVFVPEGRANQGRTSRVESGEEEAQPFGVAQLAGNFQRAYQYHYVALDPLIRDGEIVLTLTIEPSNNQQTSENINFWVLTQDGLRRVIGGAPPSTQEIATGAYQTTGPYKGTYYSTFNASGRGRYTVIVYHYADAPARYVLTAQGGLLATENANVTLP